MSGTVRELLTWAAAQVRTMEKPLGSNKNPYAAKAGHTDGLAWCATFLVAGWKVNKVPLVPGTNSAFTPSMQNGFKNAGRLHNSPRAGDVGFLFDKELGRIAHVFFVERVVGDFVKTIEGNTNLDGGRQGVGVFRHSRRWAGGATMIRGFGRPDYKAAPAPRPGRVMAMPVVSLAAVVAAARKDPPGPDGAISHPAAVRIVEAALMAEGLLSSTFAKDGSYGTVTIKAYAQWQRKLGFSGADADGVPGMESLKKLGLQHGFKVVA
ncbi:peptidoglycan-binding protein [Kribbella catacumbae]|uniref:peptidoglycan-binding protein n=1 Tax=Kribbella catacumbae TaxID=460086 RepID=UPI000364FB79|nr:peptidoglycan-binding protein [Kribbella catacumbae]